MLKMPRTRSTQSGAILVISLILLLVMSILAISMTQTSTLQERMAGNSRDADAAFQAAEAALRNGEKFLAYNDGIIPCSSLSSCTVMQQDFFSTTDLSQVNKSWWETNGTEYGTPGTKDLTDVAEDPQYVIQVRGRYKYDGITIGSARRPAYRTYYEVTAHGVGKTDTAESVTQSVYSKPE